MKALLNIVSGVLILAGALGAQNTAAETTTELARSAEERLQKGIVELDLLRAKIAEEKLPMAEALTGFEHKAAALRKEQERVQRLVDAGNLELPAIRAETKARQDELAYVGNLLDEYARSFETKLGPSEAQYYGAAVAEAKGATENTTLSMTEKFAKQIAFGNLSLTRLFEVIGGMKFPGTAVDLQGGVAEGTYALFGPVALFRAASGAAGIVMAQTGSTKPLVRPLEGPIQEGLSKLVEVGEGTLPFDPSRGGAIKALVQEFNLVHIFVKGGPIMWPLLAASILAMATVLERTLFLLNEKRKRSIKARERLFADIEAGDIGAAIRNSERSKDYVVRTLRYALDHRGKSLANALLLAQSRELKRFKRGIAILDTVITLSPLLGLLGTVTGMMGSFSLIGGDLSAPGAITGGIAEALIATAFGLGIAIVCLLPFNLLNTKVDTAQAEIEAAAKQLELLLHPHPNEHPAVQAGVMRHEQHAFAR